MTKLLDDSTLEDQVDRQPTLLVVDDSATTFAVISQTLSEQYHIVQAHNGEEAWEILQNNPYIDLVITDINMPKMNGHQLLVKIRKSKEAHLQDMPVIVITTAEDNTDKNLAFLNGANDFINKPIDDLELQARVRVHYKLASIIRELGESRKILAEQATTDPLTNLKNRRAFFEIGAANLSHTKRYKTDLSIILLDLDHFKNINDNYSHQAGDHILVGIAEVLTHMTRLEDTVGRIGGEEFAILLPDTKRLGAAVMAERIRKRIEDQEFFAKGIKIPVTASLGTASFSAEAVDTIDELLHIADNRLYLAKEGGRNRICVNDDGKSTFSK